MTYVEPNNDFEPVWHTTGSETGSETGSIFQPFHRAAEDVVKSSYVENYRSSGVVFQLWF